MGGGQALSRGDEIRWDRAGIVAGSAFSFVRSTFTSFVRSTFATQIYYVAHSRVFHIFWPHENDSIKPLKIYFLGDCETLSLDLRVLNSPGRSLDEPSTFFVRPRQLSFGARGCQFSTFLEGAKLATSCVTKLGSKLETCSWAVSRKLGSKPDIRKLELTACFT